MPCTGRPSLSRWATREVLYRSFNLILHCIIQLLTTLTAKYYHTKVNIKILVLKKVIAKHSQKQTSVKKKDWPGACLSSKSLPILTCHTPSLLILVNSQGFGIHALLTDFISFIEMAAPVDFFCIALPLHLQMEIFRIVFGLRSPSSRTHSLGELALFLLGVWKLL